MFVYPYKAGSESAKALANKLGAKRIKKENSKFKGGNKVVINWGSTNLPEEVKKSMVINTEEAVSEACNKLSFFNKVSKYEEINLPEFTTDKDKVSEWIQAGDTVLARTKLTGHSGEGIYVLNSEESLENENLLEQTKLFVKYIPKKHEYRVHVVNGEVIDARRKAIKPGINKEIVNFQIRNHMNGFIYAKGGMENTPNQVFEQALLTISACGLDFGAVDIIYNEYREKAYVLEVNTACGLEGSTVDNYAAAFEKFYANEAEVFQHKPVDYQKVKKYVLEDKAKNLLEEVLVAQGVIAQTPNYENQPQPVQVAQDDFDF